MAGVLGAAPRVRTHYTAAPVPHRFGGGVTGPALCKARKRTPWGLFFVTTSREHVDCRNCLKRLSHI